jgi:ribose 5-phosphate isomerase B
MAEAVMRQKIEEFELGEVLSVCSRGLIVLFEEPVHPGAVEIVMSRGYIATEFVSAPLKQDEITHDTVIITMTEDQKKKVLENYEGFSEVATIYEYAGEIGDIRDPFGKNKEEYECCFLQIQQLVDKIWKTKILNAN